MKQIIKIIKLIGKLYLDHMYLCINVCVWSIPSSLRSGGSFWRMAIRYSAKPRISRSTLIRDSSEQLLGDVEQRVMVSRHNLVVGLLRPCHLPSTSPALGAGSRSLLGGTRCSGGYPRNRFRFIITGWYC